MVKSSVICLAVSLAVLGTAEAYLAPALPLRGFAEQLAAATRPGGHGGQRLGSAGGIGGQRLGSAGGLEAIRPQKSGLSLSQQSGDSNAVLPLTSHDEFELALKNSGLVFVKLYASKCRKCFAVMGKFQELANTHSQLEKVAFAQVACDQVKEVADSTGVQKVPTFQVYLHGEKVDELVGEHSAPIVSKKVKQMVTSWVEEQQPALSSIEAQAEAVVQEYSPKADASDDSWDFSAPPEGMECGDDGCEIKWD